VSASIKQRSPCRVHRLILRARPGTHLPSVPLGDASTLPRIAGTWGVYEKDVDHVDHSLVICHSRSQSLGHGCGDCRNRHVLPVAFGMMVSDSGHFLASISFPIERFDYFVPVHRRPHLQTPPPLPPMAQRRRPPCRHLFIGGSCFLVALPPSGSCDSPPKHLFVAAMSWWLAQAARPASGMPRSAEGKAAGSVLSARPLGPPAQQKPLGIPLTLPY